MCVFVMDYNKIILWSQAKFLVSSLYPTTQMIHESRHFALVFAVVIAGFANAYFLLFRGTNPSRATFGVALVSQFEGAVSGLSAIYRDGDGFVESFQGEPGLYNLQLIFFVVFMLLVNVLLLNLLIALSEFCSYFGGFIEMHFFNSLFTCPITLQCPVFTRT